jgi:CBS domain containing-hemolysin-like protein
MLLPKNIFSTLIFISTSFFQHIIFGQIIDKIFVIIFKIKILVFVATGYNNFLRNP